MGEPQIGRTMNTKRNGSHPSVFMPGYVSLSENADLQRITGGILYDYMIGKRFETEGWTVKYFDMESLPGFAKKFKYPATPRLRRASCGYDILVTDLGNSTLTMGLLEEFRNSGKLSVMICHHFRQHLEKTPIRRLLYRISEERVVRTANLLVANSSHTFRKLEAMGRDSDDIVLARPGLSVPVVESPSIRREPTEILTVCGIEQRKGVLEMVKALKESGLEGVNLTVAGELHDDSEYLGTVRTEVSNLGLNSRVRFTGKLDHMSLLQEYRSADVFMMLSYWEGYGMAIAEAMAFGLPVISTTAGAIPDLVDNGITGLLVEPGDWKKASMYLRDLFRDYSLRRRLSQAALKTASGFPSWDSTTKSVFETVQERLKRKGQL